MAKKTFKDSINPAMDFISQESIDRAEGSAPAADIHKVMRADKAPEGYKINPLYVETKSRRLQLLIQPSLYEKLKKKAQTEGTSVNNLVNSILCDAVGKE